jgi:hypothetical protein
MINLKEARQMAEEMARTELSHIININGLKLLEDRCLEGRNCWFFFRNRELKVPQNFRFYWQLDFMISKKGMRASIYDFYENEDKLQKYLEDYTNYLDRIEG